MKLFQNLSLIVFSFLAITAFVNVNHNSAANHLNAPDVTGCWVYKTYKDGAYTYTKKDDFASNKPGFKFKANNEMTKRLDPNWCVRVAGPYTNLEGTYEFLEDEVIKTTYQCPISDKPSINKYKILEVSAKKLILKSLPRD